MKVSQKQREKLEEAWDASRQLRDAFANGDRALIRETEDAASRKWFSIRPKIKRTLLGEQAFFIPAHEMAQAAAYAAALGIHHGDRESVPDDQQDRYLTIGTRLSQRLLNLGRRDTNRETMKLGPTNVDNLVSRSQEAGPVVQFIARTFEDLGAMTSGHHSI